MKKHFVVSAFIILSASNLMLVCQPSKLEESKRPHSTATKAYTKTAHSPQRKKNQVPKTTYAKSQHNKALKQPRS